MMYKDLIKIIHPKHILKKVDNQLYIKKIQFCAFYYLNIYKLINKICI